MSAELDSVTGDAMKLRPEERAELLERLVDSLRPEPPPLHPSWEAELERRVAELDAGLAQSIPADQVFAEMRKIIDGR
ncbi:addiction module protein [Paucibacter sp. XJ19-41]|uniref:addiction module protein n=1 Tax=Paucibacter sp. XJ19-41 TaxID=2927824 RepID=UPI00234BFB45|nr:addiction module protein [Paucibacter sp. XJ19-41]MDC6167065.1 addiction module protein [Paucibacter sp. XJ19-41]